MVSEQLPVAVVPLPDSAATVTPAGGVLVYRKAHLFDREKLVFDVARPKFEVVRAQCALGVMICFDWFFPEVTRILALDGAQVICQPANLVLPWCQDAMRTRSIENRVFSVTANRIGMEKRGNISLTFTGKSQIVSPNGQGDLTEAAINTYALNARNWAILTTLDSIRTAVFPNAVPSP